MQSERSKEHTLGELAQSFLTSGELLDGRLPDPESDTDKRAVEKVLKHLLPSFERWQLVDGRLDEDRYTKRMRYHVPERVGRLSPRGEALAQRNERARELFFVRKLVWARLRRWGAKLRVPLAIAGGISTAVKLVLDWQTLWVAVVGIVVAAVLFLRSLISGQD